MKPSPPSSSTSRWLLILVLLILALATSALAQESETRWTEPRNLSNSGAAGSPQLLVDAGGQAHLLWQDAFRGTLYSASTDGQGWSTPQETSLPFRPDAQGLQLLVQPWARAGQGLLHAFWLQDGSLFYSQVAAANLAAPEAWSPARTLASEAIAFQASWSQTGSSLGRLQLAYVFNGSSSAGISTEAGIYVRYSDDAFAGWSTPNPVYTSPYFRGLGASQARVQIIASPSDPNSIQLAWDDRPAERVYRAVSGDGGLNWTPPILVDQRAAGDSLQAQGPANVQLAALGEHFYLLWQAGHQGASCNDYFSYSADRGLTWSAPALLAGSSQGCSERLQLLAGETTLWLLRINAASSSLSAARQGQWSPAASQPEAARFTNPDTLRTVELGCQQAALLGEQLLLAGCDPAAGDIWYLTRPLGQPESWFPTPTPTPLWSTPAAVAVSAVESLAQAADIQAAVLVPGTADNLHALWQQSGALYYALLTSSQARPQVANIQPELGEPISSLSAVIERQGYLFVVWEYAQSGELYYAFAPAGQALNSQAWSAPQSMRLPHPARGPQALVDAQGYLQLTYSVPLNEGRGLYWLAAQGLLEPGQPLAWSPPEPLFDGAAAGWAMLGQPQAALDPAGQRHLLVTRYGLPPHGPSLGLYAFIFPPSGQTAAGVEAQEVTRSAVSWSQLLAGPDGSLQRAWQSESGGRSDLWHQYSSDHGQNWSQPERITGLSSAQGPAQLLFDPAGGLHLLQISAGSSLASGGWQLQDWTFDPAAASWQAGERLALGAFEQPGLVAGAFRASGGLAAIYTAWQPAVDPEQESALAGLYLSQRPYELAGAPPPLPTFTPRPEEAELQTTPAPTATPALVYSTERQGGALQPILSNRFGGMLLGALPAGLLVAAALAYIGYRLRNRGR